MNHPRRIRRRGGRRVLRLAPLAVFALAAGCALGAREIPVERSGDAALGCASLAAAITLYNWEVEERYDSYGEFQKRNLAYGALSVLFAWQTLFSAKNPTAERLEAEDLMARARHLAAIAADKGCEGLPEPVDLVFVEDGAEGAGDAPAPRGR